MSTKIEKLRKILFDQLEAVCDPEKNLDEEVKRSVQVVDLSMALIESARVENIFIKITNQETDSFFTHQPPINAQEALSLTTGHMSYTDVMAKVIKATQDGKTRIVIDKKISQDNVHRFIEEGYTIMSSGDNTEIGWG